MAEAQANGNTKPLVHVSAGSRCPWSLQRVMTDGGIAMNLGSAKPEKQAAAHAVFAQNRAQIEKCREMLNALQQENKAGGDKYRNLQNALGFMEDIDSFLADAAGTASSIKTQYRTLIKFLEEKLINPMMEHYQSFSKIFSLQGASTTLAALGLTAATLTVSQKQVVALLDWAISSKLHSPVELGTAAYVALVGGLGTSLFVGARFAINTFSHAMQYKTMMKLSRGAKSLDMIHDTDLLKELAPLYLTALESMVDNGYVGQLNVRAVKFKQLITDKQFQEAEEALNIAREEINRMIPPAKGMFERTFRWFGSGVKQVVKELAELPSDADGKAQEIAATGRELAREAIDMALLGITRAAELISPEAQPKK